MNSIILLQSWHLISYSGNPKTSTFDQDEVQHKSIAMDYTKREGRIQLDLGLHSFPDIIPIISQD